MPAELFRETVREKRRAIPKPALVSKKRPRRVVLPMDSIDRRSDPSYRSGPVKCYTLDLHERMLIGMEATVTMEEFRRMDVAAKKELLRPLVDKGLTSREIAKTLGSEEDKDIRSVANFIYLRFRGGMERAEARHKKKGGSADPAQNNTANDTSFQDQAFVLKMGGAHDPKELAGRLLAVADLLDNNGFSSVEIQLTIKAGD